MSRQSIKKSDMNLKIFRSNKEDMEQLNNEIRYWSNGLGEIHDHGVSISEEELPLELQRAYKDLWTDEYGSICYLVETLQGCGVALLNEYDQCTADDFKLKMDNLFQFVLEDGKTISRRPEFQHATFYIGEYSVFDECHEMFAVFPANTPIEEFRTAASLLDKLVYQSVKRHSKHLNQELVRMTKNNKPNEMIRLIREGADVNYKDKFGVPVLQWATNHANSHTVELLIEHGADVNAQDSEGKTKLMLMASHGDIDVVSYLLEHGANARLKDREGRDALSFAKGSISFFADVCSETEKDKYERVIGLLEKAMIHENKKMSLSDQIHSASTCAAEPQATSPVNAKEPEYEF